MSGRREGDTRTGSCQGFVECHGQHCRWCRRWRFSNWPTTTLYQSCPTSTTPVVRVDIECSKRALICWNHKTPAQSDHYRPKAINNIFHGHVSHWVLCGGTRTRTHYKIYNTTHNVKRYNSRRQWLSRVPRHIMAKTFTLTTSHLDRPPAVTAGRRTDMPPLSISRYSIAEREKRMDISLPADITECIIAWQTQLIKRSMMIITMILKIRRSFLKETTINEPECERLRVVIWCLRHCICATSIVNAVRSPYRGSHGKQVTATAIEQTNEWCAGC